MSNVDSWQFDLEGYIREAEPDAVKRANAWQTAIGLQAVDGLPVSNYLLGTAAEHIEGSISIDEAQRRVMDYYQSRENRHNAEAEATKEGDVVSSRIARILGEHAFVFSPVQLKAIHRALFKGLLAQAGEYRGFNITKHEWVLGGDTVLYAPANIIGETLDYDFEQERRFDYSRLERTQALRHVASFASGIWQIHPFCEGNTRTTAVFVIKYLGTLGFAIDNDPFRQHSWYFRNALVRANYENLERDIHPTQHYLDLFFDNLLLDGKHELKNRYLHVDWADAQRFQEASRRVWRVGAAAG
ncbi:MAG: Fic family protein, partial [Coriobacteriales bacterium]|nr:Fic family protein [Coriobacteriales bacterium]